MAYNNQLSNIKTGDYSNTAYGSNYGSSNYGGFKNTFNGSKRIAELKPTGNDYTGLSTGNTSIQNKNTGTGFWGNASGAEKSLAVAGLASDLFGAWTQYTGNRAARRQGAKQLRQSQQDLDMKQEEHDFRVKRRKNIQSTVDAGRADYSRRDGKKRLIPNFDPRGN